MRKFIAPLVAICAGLLAFVSSAPAAPVRAQDLEGKSICWNNGFAGESTSTFGPGHQFSDSMAGEGTWSLTPHGIHIRTDLFEYSANVQKRPDGTFVSKTNVFGMVMTSTGSYC